MHTPSPYLMKCKTIWPVQEFFQHWIFNNRYCSPRRPSKDSFLFWTRYGSLPIHSNAFRPRRYSMFLPYVRGSCVSRCWSGPRPGKGVSNVRPASSNRHNRSLYLSWTGFSLSALCVSIFTDCSSPPLLDSEECAVFVDVRLPNSILSLHSSKNTPGLIQQRLHSSYEQMLVDRMCIKTR